MQHVETFGSVSDLRQRLFTAGVEHGFAFAGHGACELEEQGGFAYARFSAHENGGPGNEAPTENAVERLKARAEGAVVAAGHFREGQDAGRTVTFRGKRSAGRGTGCLYGLKRVPFPASGALSAPLRALRAAGAADIDFPYFCHGLSRRTDYLLKRLMRRR